MRNHPWSTLARILLVLAALVVLVLVLPRATANATPPMQKPVPHSIADHSDCLSCHATGVGGAIGQ